jgi:hypothetical protein
MRTRVRFLRVAALAVAISIGLVGMSGVASAAKKGSPKWCANHPGLAAAVASCTNASTGAGTGGAGDPPAITVQIDPTPLVETYQSDIIATVQVETSPSYAGDLVDISSSQLTASCVAVEFNSIAGVSGVTNASVTLDDDGNATIFIEAVQCAPGSDVVEADLEDAPYYTALGTLVASPPVVTPSGVFGYPTTSGTVTTGEVETGDTPASGDSDVYAVFYVETDPVYAEQAVELSSAELESRCGGGWNLSSFTAAPQSSNSGTVGPPMTSILDDDGNAVFLFLGVSCAAGPSEVIADVLAGSHPTYTTTFNINAPTPTI